MKKLLFVIIVAFWLNATGQQKVETFYKDSFLKNEVPEKKAKFKKIETTNEDGIVNVKVLNISKLCILKEENYKENKPVGTWYSYSTDCSLIRKRDFSKLVYTDYLIDSLFDNVINAENSQTYERAQFGENDDDFFLYFASKIQYPQEAIEAGISGKVLLQFIIKADGTIKMFSIFQGVHPYLDLEAWEVIENMPAWKSARKDGVPIDSYFRKSVKFGH